LFVAFTANAFAQISISYELKETADFYRMNQLLNKEGNSNLLLKDIKGSPYLNDEFLNGTIYTTAKTQYNNVPLRYNLYNDDLEFKNPAGEVLALAKPEIVEYAVFGDYRLVYSNYASGAKPKKGFFLLIEDGNAKLLSKVSVLFQEPTEPGAYKEAEPAKFVRRADEFFIRIGTELPIPVSNKKSVLEAFPDNRDKIEDFISKNKIKLNKQEGLTEVVKFYNSL
jgi:hypothetical protein